MEFKPLAKEIAERLFENLPTVFRKERMAKVEQIISSALEARERDVQELCEAVKAIEPSCPCNVCQRKKERLRTALAQTESWRNT
jgi:vacuolar-type H+-ATPase subunit E/Vma4